MGTNSVSADFQASELLLVSKLRDALAGAGQDLSLPQLMTMLTVAMKPGISVNDLANEVGLTQQTTSRYVSVLLGRYQSIGSEEPKDALITQEINESDPRKRALFLSQIGKATIDGILDKIY